VRWLDFAAKTSIGVADDLPQEAIMAKAKRKWKSAAEMAALLDPSTEGWDDGLYWDSDHLHLQIRGSTRSWLMRWTQSDGRVATMGLGSGFKVAQQEARRRRDRYMELVRQGIDPRKARDQERLEAGLKPMRAVATASPTVMTFRDVTRAFLADRADSWKSDDTEGHFAKQMRDYA
jgi:hypothetical protein